MKTVVLISLLAVGMQAVDGLLDHLNAWVELGIKVAGLSAAIGGAWRWMIGPGYRRLRSITRWVGEQLELIGKLDERLDSLDSRLDRNETRFARIDAVLDSLASEEAQAVRRAIREGVPVEIRDDGSEQVERRI